MNRRIIEGGRTALQQAGLPNCFSPYACTHWCTTRNAMEKEDEMCPYMVKHGEPFDGLRLPFGLGAYFYPTPTKCRPDSKFETRLNYGILLGYRMDPGVKWSGMYIVADLTDFANTSLHQNAASTSYAHCMTPHLTRCIRLERDGYRFPLSQRYIMQNETLEGMEASINEAKPDLTEMNGLIYILKFFLC